MEVPDIRILNNKLYLNHSYTVENLNYLSIVNIDNSRCVSAWNTQRLTTLLFTRVVLQAGNQ